MAKADYYQTLGVGKNASKEEIKSSYRKLAMKHHPDKNPGDAASEAKFKEASEAYQVLSDSQKKSNYDQFGHAAFENGGLTLALGPTAIYILQTPTTADCDDKSLFDTQYPTPLKLTTNTVKEGAFCHPSALAMRLIH